MSSLHSCHWLIQPFHPPCKYIRTYTHLHVCTCLCVMEWGDQLVVFSLWVPVSAWSSRVVHIIPSLLSSWRPRGPAWRCDISGILLLSSTIRSSSSGAKRHTVRTSHILQWLKVTYCIVGLAGKWMINMSWRWDLDALKKIKTRSETMYRLFDGN